MGLEELIKPSRLQKQKRRDKRLHEEVIEVGRYNGGKKGKAWREQGYQKFYEKNFPDSYPTNVRIAPKGRSTYFDDKLGLLKKFLMSHVGQKWDKVFSELNAVLDNRSLQGMHIIGHIWDFVEHDVEIRDGKVVRKIEARYWRRQFEDCRYQNYFFVHPETGILTRWCAPHRQKPAKKARFKKEKEKQKWQKRAETKTDKTPPRAVSKRPNTVQRASSEGADKTPLREEGNTRYKQPFFSAQYDADFENYWFDEWLKAEEQAAKTTKPKLDKELRLIFFQNKKTAINPKAYDGAKFSIGDTFQYLTAIDFF
jgi:hypothetical protein